MIEHINNRCNQWARWNLTGLDNGLGYPHECAFVKIPSSPNRASPVDEAAWEIDRAVRTLHADLNQAVIQFYLKRGTGDQKAKACGCTRKVFYERVHRAHVRIMEWLNDEYAGVRHPLPEEIACVAVTV